MKSGRKYFILLGIPMLLLVGIAAAMVWIHHSSEDDPELVFSTDLARYFPKQESPNHSAIRFSKLFLNHNDHPCNSRNDLFDPWLKEFNDIWQKARQGTPGRRKKWDPSEIEIGDLWEKAAPLWEEIQSFNKGETLVIYDYPEVNPLEYSLSFRHLRGLHDLVIVQAHQISLTEVQLAEILIPWVRILGELNRQTIHPVDYSISLLLLGQLWQEFPDAILQTE